MKKDSVSKVKDNLVELADQSFIAKEAMSQLEHNLRTADKISETAQVLRRRVNATQLNADEISRFKSHGRE
ncbi:MAG: hypothetical protein WBJ75_02330 [Pseudohongiellaceae bacterium]